jgi:hypothetical protein
MVRGSPSAASQGESPSLGNGGEPIRVGQTTWQRAYPSCDGKAKAELARLRLRPGLKRSGAAA